MKTIQFLSILTLLLFATCAHAFNVSFPNGGETVTMCVPTNITWTLRPFADFYRVYVDDGSDHQQVGGDLVVPTVVWNVNHAASSNCRIRIEAYNHISAHWEGCPINCHWVEASDEVLETVTGGQFTVGGHTVHVDSPNGGESYTLGQAVPVNFSVSGGTFSHCEVFVAWDGVNYQQVAPIVTCPPCSFLLVCNQTATNARVMVRKHLLDCDQVVDDVSDGTFSVSTPPPPTYSVHVTYPNGGENLNQHVPTNISWTIGVGNLYNFFRVYLRTDAQPDWQQLGNDVVTPGMIWNVDHEPATGCRIKVEGYTTYLRNGVWHWQLQASDESDNSFTIGTQTVHVEFPNGGESFLVGVPDSISYTAGGGAYVACDVLLSADGGATYPFPIQLAVVRGTELCSVGWLPVPITNTARIKVVKHLLDGTTIEDESDANFSIVAAPSITVTSPNGIHLAIGQTVLINWVNEGGNVDSYSIDRSDDGGVSYPVQIVAGLGGQVTHYIYVVQGPASSAVKFRVTANYFQGALHIDDANDDNCTVEAASAAGPTQVELPATVELAQNFPNPFNPTTTIGFDLPKSVAVRLTVHNILGQTVAMLANNEVMSAGHHSVQFDGANLPSGLYFYRLQAGEMHFEKRMMLTK